MKFLLMAGMVGAMAWDFLSPHRTTRKVMAAQAEAQGTLLRVAMGGGGCPVRLGDELCREQPKHRHAHRFGDLYLTDDDLAWMRKHSPTA